MTVTIDELRGRVGEEIAVSDWFEVNQSVIDGFAEVTGDRQWIHVDPAKAAADSPYGRPVAHGFLTLSLLSRMSAQAVQVSGDFRMRINYGLNRVRFPAPVPAGSRIRARMTLASIQEFGEGYHLVWSVLVEVEGGEKPAAAAEWLVRFYR